MSQGASEVSGFTLGYKPSGSAGSPSAACPCWVFSMPAQDVAGAQVATAAVQTTAATGLGDWTLLTGVFHAGHSQLLLYVDGGDVGIAGGGTAGDQNPAATASPVTAWTDPATGVLRLGASWSKVNGVPTLADFFNGSIADACAFYGVLQTSPSQPDVQTLYNGGPPDHVGDGCATLNTKY